VLAAMRELLAEAEALHERARELMPRNGEVAAGGAHMDFFLPANAVDEFLRELRRGHDVGVCVLFAKHMARESVRKWNAHRGADYQTHRWVDCCNEAIERAARKIITAQCN
jgi:hypothetical protein